MHSRVLDSLGICRLDTGHPTLKTWISGKAVALQDSWDVWNINTPKSPVTLWKNYGAWQAISTSSTFLRLLWVVLREKHSHKLTETLQSSPCGLQFCVITFGSASFWSTQLYQPSLEGPIHILHLKQILSEKIPWAGLSSVSESYILGSCKFPNRDRLIVCFVWQRYKTALWTVANPQGRFLPKLSWASDPAQSQEDVI